MSDQENAKSAKKPIADLSQQSQSQKGESQKGQTMWGGRFGAGPSAVMQEINASIGFDKRLYAEDIAGSTAHADMLAATGIISTQDRDAIHKGLAQVKAEIEAGEFTFDPALEDIHMHIEARLRHIVGDAGARLHTARSRNDQVATDFRLWCRGAVDRFDGLYADFISALLDVADAHAGTIMPGFTHLQTAQPVTLGHHIMAYAEMAFRDRARLADCRKRLNESPLGAAALAGTGFPIDRHQTAEALSFDAPMANSLDAVSSRDFALELMAALSIAATHLSRLADEIVLWATPAFGFLTLSDSFSTGSSIMPQKRNPDAAELVRAKVGRISGSLSGLMMVMKGLPLAYSKDMQEDKEPVFQAVDDFELCLVAMTGMMADFHPNPTAMREAAGQGFSTATDLADWLVRELKMPFRDAHHVTGAIVKLAEDQKCDLAALPLVDMQSVEPKITEAVFDVLSVEASVASRISFGGTAPDNVRAQIEAAHKKLAADET